MNKIDKALDYFLKYILCSDRRKIEAREYLKKFKEIRDSMNPEELQDLKSIFHNKRKKSI